MKFGFDPFGFRVKVGAGRNGVVNRCVGVGTTDGDGDGTSVTCSTGALIPAATS